MDQAWNVALLHITRWGMVIGGAIIVAAVILRTWGMEMLYSAVYSSLIDMQGASNATIVIVGTILEAAVPLGGALFGIALAAAIVRRHLPVRPGATPAIPAAPTPGAQPYTPQPFTPPPVGENPPDPANPFTSN
jgi:hypothetical protein